MTQISEVYKKEKRVEFVQDFTSFAFEIGYSYIKIDGCRNLIHLTFAFWHINLAWCFHKWGDAKNIIHKSPDKKTTEVMPWLIRKCEYCGKNKWPK